jgi:hypothetical protein
MSSVHSPRPAASRPRDVHQAREGDERAGERVEEELGRRPLAVGRAELVDQHEHRQQRELEADVEQHEVAGGEHADHRRLQTSSHA